jgi:hypothetical protein
MPHTNRRLSDVDNKRLTDRDESWPKGRSRVHLRYGPFRPESLPHPDLAGGTDQTVSVQRWIVGTVKIFQPLIQIGEARLEAPPKALQNGKVGLVNAVHVAGYHGRHDV